MRSHAATWAESQAGMHERGQTNCGARINRWTRAMGLKPCPRWCGAFVHQAFLQAGVQPVLASDRPRPHLRRRGRGPPRAAPIAITSVRRGDILLFAFRPRLKASHLAIVRAARGTAASRPCEGNVANAVRLKVRGLAVPGAGGPRRRSLSATPARLHARGHVLVPRRAGQRVAPFE